MKYKVGDLVYFDGGKRKGVGKIVSIIGDRILVNSTQIVGGHDGNGFVDKQNNDNNWYFLEEELKPFTKKIGQKYKVISNNYNAFKIGDIVTLTNLQINGISSYKSEDEELFLHDIDHRRCEVEFYADVEDAKEQKENEMFTKEDLKVGYLVKVRKGILAHVVNTEYHGLCLNYEEGRGTFNLFNNDLTSKLLSGYDVVEVYGFTREGYNAHKFEIGNRKLLWKREEVKEMTIEDIQKALGHKIKVVE